MATIFVAQNARQLLFANYYSVKCIINTLVNIIKLVINVYLCAMLATVTQIYYATE